MIKGFLFELQYVAKNKIQFQMILALRNNETVIFKVSMHVLWNHVACLTLMFDNITQLAQKINLPICLRKNCQSFSPHFPIWKAAKVGNTASRDREWVLPPKHVCE